MKTPFDIKSVVCGLALGVLATLVVGAGVSNSTNGPAVGRFQITGSGALFTVLDTATGQVWLGDFHSSLDGRVPPDWRDIPAARDAFFSPKLVPDNTAP